MAEIVNLREGGGDNNPPADQRLLLSEFDCSDLGNARRLKVLAGARLAYVEDRWLAFDGLCWNAKLGARLALAAAQEVADHIWSEAAAVTALAGKEQKGSDAHKRLTARANELRDWALDSGNAGKSAAMLRQAQTLLAREAEEFDTHLEAFNCQNGTVWVDRDAEGRIVFERRDHDPGDLITKLAAVTYDPDAQCPRWTAHMAKVLPHADVRDFFQACSGYWLSGHHREQKFWLLIGRGGDGKSTTMNVLRRVMGGYGASADAKLFLESRDRDANEASPAMARLAGDIRLVSLPEPGKGKTFAEDALKKFTGGGEIVARHLRGETFEFVARGKGVMECNVKPHVKSGDDGLFRRLVPISFPTQIDKSEMVRGVEDLLFAEAAGILNWMLAGMRAWLEAAGGLDGLEPERVSELREDYRRGGDSFTEWFLDFVVVDPKAEPVEQKKFYDNYTAWCAENDIEKPLSAKSFGAQLSDRQIIFADRGGEKGRKRVKGGRLKDGVDRYVERKLAEGEARDGEPGEGSAPRPPGADFGDFHPDD